MSNAVAISTTVQPLIHMEHRDTTQIQVTKITCTCVPFPIQFDDGGLWTVHTDADTFVTNRIKQREKSTISFQKNVQRIIYAAVRCLQW